MKRMLIQLIAVVATFLPLGLLADRDSGHDSRHRDTPRGVAGAVYTTDNSPAGNNVWAFGRRADGSLTSARVFPTGGLGTGGGLGNQGSVLLSSDGRWLFTCNAGSDEISVFAVRPHGLMLTDKVQSQGKTPVSLTLHRNLLFVLNAGAPNNIAGFIFVRGRLLPLSESVSPLSADDTGPAQIAFTSSGDQLVVTEKGTGLVDVFSLDCDGSIAGMNSYPSPAPPPFGFAAGSRNRIFVTQAAGGGANPGASSVSSYQVTRDGELEVISDSVATLQTAACWLVLTGNERFAFTANTPNDSVSSFRVDRDGQLDLLDSQAAVLPAGSGPVDMAISRDERFLYSLNSGSGTIGSFRLNHHTGRLTPITNAASVPATANGLAVR